jgi:hypothetical protein
MRQESALLSRILTQGMEAGKLRPLNQKGLDILTFVLIRGLHGLEREMLIEKDHDWLDPAIDTLSHMIMNGLKT